MEPNNNKKLKVFVIVFIVIVLIALLTTGLIYYFNDKSKNNTDNNDIQSNDTNTEIVTPSEEGRNLQNEANALKANYSDVVGWLKVPGTNIDTPIFQSNTNDRYLRHDRDNKRTNWGENFLDFRCRIDNMDNMSHFIIYGHNTETNDHFTPLLNYKSKDFFEANKVIEFSTTKGNYKWEIFATYITDINFYYIETTFADKNAYGSFLNSLKAASMYDTGVNVTAEDTILTLSTCDYSRKDGRFVVQAKLIK